MTDLADFLRRRIELDGPISVADYMNNALGHPQFGYYIRQDPFGFNGDFITAPEISQMFGELIGLWCAATWDQMGRPKETNLVELGPGRGTLMSDALRATRGNAAFCKAINLHLIETNKILKARQRETLSDREVYWHESLESLPDGPAIFLANEFFDALPVHQLVSRNGVWHERMVSYANDGFEFVLEKSPSKLSSLLSQNLSTEAPHDGIVEISPASIAVANAIGRNINKFDGAALIIDYGYLSPHSKDTLQAVRRHRYVDVLETPGRADITAHVDFTAIARAVRGFAKVYGPVNQGEWLKRLGIEYRRNSLATTNEKEVHEIESSYRRLTDSDQMGTLFKVIAITRTSATAPAGFEGDQ